MKTKSIILSYNALLKGFNMLRSMQIGVQLRQTALLLLTCISFAMANASYPYLYAAIGTPTYQAAEGYRALIGSEYFTASKETMRHFIKESDRLKDEGFRLDEGNTKEDRKVYIEALRQLEKQRNKIDRLVVKSIRMLKAQKLNAELSVLAKSPYPLIRKRAKVHAEQEMTPGGKQVTIAEKDTETLRRSLMSLREELQQARAGNAENVACLNDITAINYWMLKADTLKQKREWCKTADVCRQIIEFEHAAGKNCGKENARYLEWSAASKPYRTTFKQMFEEACHR